MHTAKQLAIFFLGRFPCAGQPIKINGAINILCTVLCFVAASTAEAELRAFFHNAKEAKNNKTYLGGVGASSTPHPHPHRHFDNRWYCEQYHQEAKIMQHGNLLLLALRGGHPNHI
jgi:hypothetical protein